MNRNFMNVGTGFRVVAELPATGTPIATAAPSPPPPTASYGNLYFYPQPFDRKTPRAIFETLHYDGSTPLTVEGWVMTSPTQEVINHGKGSGSKRPRCGRSALTATRAASRSWD